MGRKSKYTKEEKIAIVKRYDEGEGSLAAIANEMGVNKDTVHKWVHQFHKHGAAAFGPGTGNASYTWKFKEEVVQAYLNGEGSYRELAMRFNIPSHAIVIHWVKVYNDPEGLKDYCPQGDVYKMKSRKTTLNERKEIVRYCMDHDKDYRLTARIFNVPYANVYSWVQKYFQNGDEGLGDHRGRHKPDGEVDELTLLKRKLERAERERDIAQMENRLLKKVEEIERGRFGRKAGMRPDTGPSKK